MVTYSSVSGQSVANFVEHNVGVGLLDFLILPSVDTKGNVYPALGSFNDPDLKQKQPSDCEKIIYVIKANGPLNSKIHSNCFTQIASGHVKFLIKEQDAKTKLLATKVGSHMKAEERIERLLPHEMTTRLFDEMTNLRAKQTGNDIVLEMINKRRTKDKFSSLEYGLWRIKEHEEEYFKLKYKRKKGLSNFIFYS